MSNLRHSGLSPSGFLGALIDHRLSVEAIIEPPQAVRPLDVTVAGPGLATLDDAEETLARLRIRQKQNELTASAMKEMETSTRPAGIIEKLANAGCGAPLRSSADDVLARLRSRINPAA
jgi:phage shock protein A